MTHNGGPEFPDRTFEAILFGWEGTAVADPEDDTTSVRDRVEALTAAGVDLTIISRADIGAVDAQLRARPSGPGRLFVASNLGSEMFELTPSGPAPRRVGRGVEGRADTSGAVRWVLADLWTRGVGAGLVLVVGCEFGAVRGGAGTDAAMLVPEATRSVVVSVGPETGGLPFGVRRLGGGPERLLALLDDQLERRRRRRVPAVDEDPRWIVELRDGPREHVRVREALTTVADGSFGTRGALEKREEGSSPMVVAAGVYDSPDADRVNLLPGPEWTALGVHTLAEGRRIFDLRTGLLWREAPTPAGVLRTLRFAALARPGVAGLRAEAPDGDLEGDDCDPSAPPRGDRWRTCIRRAESRRGGGIVAAVAEIGQVQDGLRTVERLVALHADPGRRPLASRARTTLGGARRTGFDAILAEQRATWAEQWNDAYVAIEGDEASELGTRFALFHLVSTASAADEAAVGARGLSGPAYDGHVFWDADVYVLPVLAAVAPERARAMLEYRVRRLPAARSFARERGDRGARFPWESADDGTDVTPEWVHDDQGRRARIHTGEHADHIASDVAWAAARYTQFTGDHAFLAGPGRPLVEEAARFLASRARVGADGRAHLYGVVGPDEYHGVIDDDAYTNVMARWTLRRAARDHRAPGSPEVGEWRALADALVDGYDPATGVYEQHAGFHDLDPLLITEVAEVPVAADLLLGHHRVTRSQVVKQPDVLMLHFLVPEEVAPGSLEPNLDFYGPRTAHGSSLSPAVHAGLLARAGRVEEALTMFRLAARLDLDDLTATTAGGLHVATMGGLWQALVHGFLGVRIEGDELVADPHLPAAWRSVEVGFRFRGRRVRVRASGDRAELDVGADEQPETAGLEAVEIPIAGGGR